MVVDHAVRGLPVSWGRVNRGCGCNCARTAGELGQGVHSSVTGAHGQGAASHLSLINAARQLARLSSTAWQPYATFAAGKPLKTALFAPCFWFQGGLAGVLEVLADGVPACQPGQRQVRNLRRQQLRQLRRRRHRLQGMQFRLWAGWRAMPQVQQQRVQQVRRR